jgi:predicted dehydrogenase
MTRPTLGLAGCGLWGRLVVRDLILLGADVAVADPDPAAQAAARQNGARIAVADPQALPDADAYIVATPAVTHAAVAGVLLPRGTPLLVEKPLTTDATAAERLAAEGDGRLFVGHTWRYHPGVEMLGAIARSGEIGATLGLRSTRANWTSPRTDVDSVWNMAPHDLTLALEIFGRIPTPRAALAEIHGGRAVGMTALLGTDPWLVFDVSNRYPDKRREVRLHATGGVAVMRDPDSGQIEITRGDAASHPSETSYETRPFLGESALTRELRAFLDFVRGGPPPKSAAAEGVAVVTCLAHLRELAGLSAATPAGPQA